MKRPALFLCFLLVSLPALPQAFPEKGPEQRYYKDKSKFSFDFSSQKKGGEIRWTTAPGGRQEFVRDEYVILEGEVKIYYQDIILSGDKITYNLKTKDAVAEGNVILDQGPRRLSAERIVFNLDSQTGTLFNAKGSFEPSIYFMGEKIEKLDEDTYRLTNGVFTSCDMDNPSWSFKLASGLITMNDYAHLQNIQFRAHKTPLFWLPRLVWPTKGDRSQGLLIPKPGYSSRFGSFLKTAYFIPFGDSADATITAEGYSKGYYAAGLETNYVPSTATKGKLEAYGVHDEQTGKLEWKYAYTHTQDNLPGGFRGVIAIQNFSNLNFFQSFEHRFELNTLSNIYSSAYLTKNVSNYSLNLRADRREYFLGPTTKKVFEQLPAVEFRTYPNRIAGPLYFSLESSASHLRTSFGADYYRADFHPNLTMQLRTPAWLSIRPLLSVRETYYTSTMNPVTQKISDDPLSRTYVQGEVEFVGPSFSRVFNEKVRNFVKFKHVIEPRIRYLYTSDVPDQIKVIRFDAVDSPFLPLVPHAAEYGLTQRILGKESGENASVRDLMSLTIKQSVSLSKPFESTSSTAPKDKFSPLQITAHVNPYQRITIDAGLTYGATTHQLDQTSLAANLSGKDSYLNLTWFSSYLRPGQTTGDASQVRFSTGFPILKNRLRADAQVNMDVNKGEVLEQRYVAGIFASCYTVSLEYRDFLQLRGVLEPIRSRDYMVSVSLKNVGTFVDLRGSLDSLF